MSVWNLVETEYKQGTWLEYVPVMTETVEAIQFIDKNKDRIFNSLTGQYAADFEDGKPILKVTTIHGDIAIVRLGDWIIKENTPGYYYPIKDDIFRRKYHPLNNT